VSNHGFGSNRTFLNDRIAQDRLIDSLAFLIRYREADGVDIDFENVPKESRLGLTNFVARLSTRLRAINSDYVISICLPAEDANKAFDILALDKHVDLFVVMGYDYHGAKSKVAGPVAPLFRDKKWQTATLNSSVNTYLSRGLARSKMILALPYYGAAWKTNSKLAPSQSLQFLEHLTYKEIARRGDLSSAKLDEESYSKYIVTETDTPGRYYQLWFDDSTTLDRKMDFVQQQGLGGVGLWALGYDNGLPQFWQLIDNRFSKDKGLLLQAARERRRWGLIGWLRMYKTPLIAAAFFILFFLVLGFLLSFNDWRVRDALFYSGSSRTIYAGIFFLLAVAILSFSGKYPSKTLVMAGGLFLGLALALAVSRVVIRRRRELP